MDIFQWEQNPWGQEILIRISWDLFWLSMAVGAAFVIGHLIYRAKNPPAKAEGAVTDASAAGIPDKVVRHSVSSRLFHWVMTVAVFVLLVTGFFPVLGIQFNWLAIHWIAGLAFIATIVFHIVHASFWLKLRDMWIDGKDWSEWKQEMRRVMSKGGKGGPPPPKSAKYPVDQRLFHGMISLAAFGVMLTGLVMLVRVDTPLFARNPYLFADSTWGLVYVIHGLSAVGFVGMLMAHVYFAVLPEKRWMTISMIVGWITKKDFVEHHDPERWVVTEEKASE